MNKKQELIYNTLQRAMDIVEEIRTIDYQLNRLKEQASMFSNDMGGEDTNATLHFKVKDMKSVKEELSILNTKESSFEQGPNAHPLLQMFDQPYPIEKEHQAHKNNTESTVLHFDPSESLLLIESLKNILITRRNKYLQLLEETFPAVKVGK